MEEQKTTQSNEEQLYMKLDKEELLSDETLSQSKHKERDLNTSFVAEKPKKKKKKHKGKKTVKEAAKMAPVKVPKKKAVPIKEQVENAVYEFVQARQYAYLIRRQEKKELNNYKFLKSWGGLSLNQRIKRTEKAEIKQNFQALAKTFLDERNAEKNLPAADKLPEMEFKLTPEKMEAFLAIKLDQFQLDTDEMFTAHLVENYALADQAEEMEKLLEQVVREEVNINEGKLMELTKQVSLLKSVKEWMDARLELISDPYYVLLSSQELSDSSSVLEGLRNMDKWELQNKKGQRDEKGIAASGRVRAFLEKYEKVKNCTFNRTLHREHNEQFKTAFDQRVTEAGGIARTDIRTRQSLDRDKKQLSAWRENNENLVAFNVEKDGQFREADPELAVLESQLKEFEELPLTNLKFSSVDEIQNNFEENQKLFSQAEFVQNQLAQYLWHPGAKMEDVRVLTLRAKIAFFQEAKERQFRLFDRLKQEDILEGQTLNEWLTKQNILIDNPQALYDVKLNQLNIQRANEEQRLREMWKELNTDRPKDDDEIRRDLESFQKNLVFWETIRDTKKNLSFEDIKTQMAIDKWCKENGKEPYQADRALLIFLRGKDKTFAERVLEDLHSDYEDQRNAVQLEITAQVEVRLKQQVQSYELPTGEEGTFLKGLASKMSDAELATVMPRQHKNAGDDINQELQLHYEFVTEVIQKRIDTLVDMASDENILYTAGLSFKEIRDIKERRVNFAGMLKANKNTNEGKQAADRLFQNIDKLQIAEFEAEEKKNKNKVKTAVLLDTDLQKLYQSYRKAAGFEVVDRSEAQKRKEALAREIASKKTDPLFASVQDLRDLRLLCIDTLIEETGIREDLLYDLSTASLKRITQQILQGKLEVKALEGEIKKTVAAEKKYNEEQEEPDWSTKEQDVIDLMADLTEKKAGTVTDGTWLLTILTKHLETIADFANESDNEYGLLKRRYDEILKENEYLEQLPAMIQSIEDELAKDDGSDPAYRTQLLMKDLPFLQNKQEELQKSMPQRMEELRNLEAAMEKLGDKGVTRQDAMTTILSKMTGPEKEMLSGINDSLKAITTHLRNEMHGRKMTMKNVSTYLSKDDPVLKELLEKASAEIQQKIDASYDAIQEVIEMATDNIFEDRRAIEIDFTKSLGSLFDDLEELKEEQHIKEDQKQDDQNVIKEEPLPANEIVINEEKKKELDPQAKKTIDDALELTMPDQATTIQRLGKEAVTATDEADSINKRMEQIWSPAYGEGKFVNTILKNYFKLMNEPEEDQKLNALKQQDKRSMICSMLKSLKPEGYDRGHARTNELKKAGRYLGGMVKGAGPLLQKKLQGVPEEALTLELRLAVEDVKSNLAAIEKAYVDQELQTMIDESNGEIESLEIEESLGAASVGQAFRVKVKGKNIPDGTRIVLKLLRPDAEERIEREKKILLKCASEDYMQDGGAMEKTYKGELSKIDEELDLQHEAENCKQGEIYISKPEELKDTEGKVGSVRLFNLIKPTKTRMVMDEAKGTTVDRFVKRSKKERQIAVDTFRTVERKNDGTITHSTGLYMTQQNVPEIKTKRLQLVKQLADVKKRHAHLEALSKKWVTESLYGSGFYHGDMHSGNIMVNDEQATVLDYGNATQLTQEQREIITCISAAVAFDRSEDFINYFMKLVPDTNEKKKQMNDPKWLADPVNAMERTMMQRAILEIMTLGDADFIGQKIYLCLLEMQKRGLEIPPAVFSFSQSELRLQNAIQSLIEEGKLLKAAIHNIDNMGVKNPMADAVLVTQYKGIGGDKEAYFRSTITALEDLNKDEFMQLLKSKDEKNQQAFNGKYMLLANDLELFMSGEKMDMLQTDDPEDPVYYPGFTLEPAVWKKKFQNLAKKIANAKNPEDPALKNEKRAFINETESFYMGNPVMEELGLNDVAYRLHRKAFKDMDVQAFNEYADFIETAITPYLQISKDVKALQAMQPGPQADALAEKIFQTFNSIHEKASNQHSVIESVRSVLYAAVFDKETLKDDEMEYGLNQKKMMRAQAEKELAPWFLDGADGVELKTAYQEFCRIQDLQIPEKFERGSTVFDAELKEAERRFLKIYKKMAVVRLKDFVKGFDAVPEDPSTMKGFMEIMTGVISEKKGDTISALRNVDGYGATVRYGIYAFSSKDTSDMKEFNEKADKQQKSLTDEQVIQVWEREYQYDHSEATLNRVNSLKEDLKDKKALVEKVQALQANLNDKKYGDFVRSLSPLLTDLFERIMRDQHDVSIKAYYRVVKGEKVWSKAKLDGTKRDAALKKAYGENFGYGTVNPGSMLAILADETTDKKQKTLLDGLQPIIQGLQQLKPEEIDALTDAEIKQRTGSTAKQIANQVTQALSYTKVTMPK